MKLWPVVSMLRAAGRVVPRMRGRRTGKLAVPALLALAVSLLLVAGPAPAVTASPSAVGGSAATANPGGAPVLVRRPTVTGPLLPGTVAQADPGEWRGSPRSFTYRWRVCSAAEGCRTIGRDSPRVTLRSWHRGRSIEVRVTATNAHGARHATSRRSAPIGRPLPSQAPSVSGDLVAGGVLTADPGVWRGGATAYHYRWMSCVAESDACAPLGEDADRLVLGEDVVGNEVEVRVAATNAWGSRTARSARTASVVAPPPSATEPPVVTGSAVVGQVLHATQGTWSGEPTSFVFEWRSCAPSSDDCSVFGADGPDVTVRPEAAGRQIEVKVTATSPAGTGTARSPRTAAVVFPPPPPTPAPSAVAAPLVTGDPIVFDTLHASAGSWLGGPTGFGYQWRACDPATTACVDFGDDRSDVTLGPDQDGRKIQVAVTASNAGGSTAGVSALTAAVTPPPVPTSTLAMLRGATCTTRRDDSVHCWGQNVGGELMPVPADLGPVRALSGAVDYVCATRVDDTVLCWGHGQYGQATVPPGLGQVRQVDTGEFHACAVGMDRAVTCWGNPFSGALTPPAGLGPVRQVSVGSGYTCAVRLDYTAACWGTPSSSNGANIVPANLGSVLQVAAEGRQTCAVRSDHSVTCWGGDAAAAVPADLGEVDEIGVVSEKAACAVRTDRTVACWTSGPSYRLTSPADLDQVTQLSTGSAHVCAARADGEPVCWGTRGYLGAFDYGYGESTYNDRLGPVGQIVAGYDGTCGVRANGQIACWGDNLSGQTQPPADLGEVAQVAIGRMRSCAVRPDQSLACWGATGGSFGTPGDLGAVRAVSVGNDVACVIRSDETVRCWGDNLGDQGGVVPPGLGPVARISVARSHVCAITTSQAAVCWGDDTLGQSSPPADLGPVTAISAGEDHTCAIRVDGTAACWGWGNTIDGTAWVPVDLGPVTHIAAGYLGTCAIKVADSTVACWGGFAEQMAVPTDLGPVTAISAGARHMCAIRVDQTAVCWGENLAGQTIVPPGR